MNKIINKIVLSVLLAFIVTGCLGCAGAENEDVAEASPTAQKVASEMGIGLNLGNTMEAYNASDCEKITYEWIPVVGSNTPRDYETYWGAVETTQEVIDGIKAEGFNTVRIPVFWGNMMKNDGTYDRF